MENRETDQKKETDMINKNWSSVKQNIPDSWNYEQFQQLYGWKIRNISRFEAYVPIGL